MTADTRVKNAMRYADGIIVTFEDELTVCYTAALLRRIAADATIAPEIDPEAAID